MSSPSTPRPIPYIEKQGDSHFFEEEFIDQFPTANQWIVFGLCQMSELHSRLMRCNTGMEGHYRGELDATCKAVVRLMSMEQLEWSASRCHPNTPYGELFYTELAERLLIQND